MIEQLSCIVNNYNFNNTSIKDNKNISKLFKAINNLEKIKSEDLKLLAKISEALVCIKPKFGYKAAVLIANEYNDSLINLVQKLIVLSPKHALKLVPHIASEQKRQEIQEACNNPRAVHISDKFDRLAGRFPSEIKIYFTDLTAPLNEDTLLLLNIAKSLCELMDQDFSRLMSALIACKHNREEIKNLKMDEIQCIVSLRINELVTKIYPYNSKLAEKVYKKFSCLLPTIPLKDIQFSPPKQKGFFNIQKGKEKELEICYDRSSTQFLSLNKERSLKKSLAHIKNQYSLDVFNVEYFSELCANLAFKDLKNFPVIFEEQFGKFLLFPKLSDRVYAKIILAKWDFYEDNSYKEIFLYKIEELGYRREVEKDMKLESFAKQLIENSPLDSKKDDFFISLMNIAPQERVEKVKELILTIFKTENPDWLDCLKELIDENEFEFILEEEIKLTNKFKNDYRPLLIEELNVRKSSINEEDMIKNPSILLKNLDHIAFKNPQLFSDCFEKAFDKINNFDALSNQVYAYIMLSKWSLENSNYKSYFYDRISDPKIKFEVEKDMKLEKFFIALSEYCPNRNEACISLSETSYVMRKEKMEELISKIFNFEVPSEMGKLSEAIDNEEYSLILTLVEQHRKKIEKEMDEQAFFEMEEFLDFPEIDESERLFREQFETAIKNGRSGDYKLLLNFFELIQNSEVTFIDEGEFYKRLYDEGLDDFFSQ